MADFRISPAGRPLRGALRVPADKSLSHRAVILGALAEGDTRIENFLRSETTGATVDCLRALGADIQESGADALVVHGRGLHSLREPQDILFCKGSGTTMRLLAGVCAGQDSLSILDGTPALRRRPMGRVVEPLRAMGATIVGRDHDRLPPLALRGGGLHGIDYALPVASAQVKSAVLLAGLFADGPTTVREPAPSRDHTERMLQAFGAKLARESEAAVRLEPAGTLRAPDRALRIPADFSSAAFFLVAALLIPGSTLCLERVGLNPTRSGLLEALARMGAAVEREKEQEENGEPVGDLVVRATELIVHQNEVGALVGTEVSGAEVPRMIDEFPVLAVAATQARGETRVRDAAELRVKESDRIASLAAELRKMGAQFEPHADGFTVAGPTRLRGARVQAHGDHRLAMSLAVAGLLAEGETTVEGWECVMDSFPDFPECLARVTGTGPRE